MLNREMGALNTVISFAARCPWLWGSTCPSQKGKSANMLLLTILCAFGFLVVKSRVQPQVP